MIKKTDLTSDFNEAAEVLPKARKTKTILKVSDSVKETPVSLHEKQCTDLLAGETLDSVNPPVRCFYLNDGKVFFGVLFKETGDSFLVGAPARLALMEDRSIKAHPITSQSVIRLMKSSNIFVTSPDGYKYHYFKYLLDEGIGLLPDYMIDERIEFLTAEITKAEEIANAPRKKSSNAETGREMPRLESLSENDDGELYHPIIMSRAIH